MPCQLHISQSMFELRIPTGHAIWFGHPEASILLAMVMGWALPIIKVVMCLG